MDTQIDIGLDSLVGANARYLFSNWLVKILKVNPSGRKLTCSINGSSLLSVFAFPSCACAPFVAPT